MLHIPDEDVSNAVNRVVVTLGALGVPPVREGAGNGLSGRVSDSEGLGCVPTPRKVPGANEGDG